MKIWKKLMVVGVAVVLVSTAVATQYINVNSDATLEVETKTSNLQLCAHDPSVTGTHNYTLANTSSNGYSIDLGTWGEHNEFTSTGAFLIVNAGSQPLNITDVRITGDTSSFFTAANVYLHGGEHARALSDGGDGSNDGVEYVQVSEGTDETDIYLEDYGGDAYSSGSVDQLSIKNETGTPTDFDASWEKSDPSTSRYIWYLSENPNLGFAAGDTSFDGGAGNPTNAVWVRIDVDPSAVPTTNPPSVTMSFDVSYN